MSLDLDRIRAQFPALQRDAIFLDNPGGTQVAQACIDRTTEYYVEHNSNRGGAFATSRESDRVIENARQAMADMLGADRRQEIVFGPNMTSLTLSLSRSIAETLTEGGNIVVTRLDHDANISPWLHVAEAKGCQIHWVDFDVETGMLNLDSFEKALEYKPKLVAFGYASNALGTINPVKEMVDMAHAAGALVFIDAVQYAPHGPLDVQEIGCDFLACSPYKFFGPHLGVLYGRYDLLESLNAYKVRPAPKLPPGKFETGTQNHEGIAGLLGALEYLQWLGQEFGGGYADEFNGKHKERSLELRQGLAVIREYEYELSRALMDVFHSVPGLQLHGPTNEKERVPTFSFTLEGWRPRKLAEALGEKDIFTWNGNYYALAVTERLGLEEQGGMLRVGAVHYNTLDEVETLGETIYKLMVKD
ncbi:MAG: cysteine desulfurase-like protein [Chloroflexi bacterium]|nr:MAG: cysteine desulfurase-like protein [Chloroflexota bacterium]MBL1192801.1 cysteine desulfurase-like protein [Chloroflexota bacterium]NOH10095.1 cysteine desulfurase-like protein [Chloroflexota bacterium]